MPRHDMSFLHCKLQPIAVTPLTSYNGVTLDFMSVPYCALILVFVVTAITRVACKNIKNHMLNMSRLAMLFGQRLESPMSGNPYEVIVMQCYGSVCV